MNEVTLLQVKTHWSTLKEFDCIIQTQNCVGGHLSTKLILMIQWVAMAFYVLFKPGGKLLKMNNFKTVQATSTLKDFDCIIQMQKCEINTVQEKKIMSSHKRNYIYNFIEQIYLQKFIWCILVFSLMYFFYEHSSLPV